MWMVRLFFMGIYRNVLPASVYSRLVLSDRMENLLSNEQIVIYQNVASSSSGLSNSLSGMTKRTPNCRPEIIL